MDTHTSSHPFFPLEGGYPPGTTYTTGSVSLSVGHVFTAAEDAFVEITNTHATQTITVQVRTGASASFADYTCKTKVLAASATKKFFFTPGDFVHIYGSGNATTCGIAMSYGVTKSDSSNAG